MITVDALIDPLEPYDWGASEYLQFTVVQSLLFHLKCVMCIIERKLQQQERPLFRFGNLENKRKAPVW